MPTHINTFQLGWITVQRLGCCITPALESEGLASAVLPSLSFVKDLFRVVRLFKQTTPVGGAA